VFAVIVGLVGASVLAASPAWAGIATPQSPITVGTNPVGVTFNLDGTRGYVAISSGNQVDVVDSVTGTLLTPITVCSGPMGIGIVSATKAYVPCDGAHEVAVVNLTTGLTESYIPVGTAPFFIAMSPDRSKAYVPNSAGSGGSTGTVSVIDTADDTVTATIPVGLAPVAVAFNPLGTTAYVANGTASAGGNSVSVIDVATSTVTTTIPLAGVPYGVAVSPDGASVYVSRINGGKISIINALTNTVGTTFTLPVGTKPEGVTFSPDGRRVYVPTLANGVVVIDATTETVLPSLASGSGSRILAFTPDGTLAYVTNNLGGTVSVFSFDNALPTITGTPDGGTPDVLYSFAPAVTGSGVTVTVQSGLLPPGLSLAAGVIAGTPTSPGSYPVTLRATNDNGFADLAVTFDIEPPAFSVSFDTAGGSAGPADQSVTSGQPATAPPVPTRAGYAFDGWWSGGTRWNFATDTVTAAVTLTAHWLVLPTITGAATANAPLDAPFTWTPTISALAGYSVTSTGLPAGLTLAPGTGVISGEPTGALGATPVTLTVTDDNGTASLDVTLTVTRGASAPSDLLAFTGGTVVFWLVPLGLGALAAGVGLLAVSARRRRGRLGVPRS
jgi:uncharacterized repeat protein (TIGR02543 family)